MKRTAAVIARSEPAAGSERRICAVRSVMRANLPKGWTKASEKGRGEISVRHSG